MPRNLRNEYPYLVVLPLAILLFLPLTGHALGGEDERLPPPLMVDPDLFPEEAPAEPLGGPSFEDQIMEMTNQERWDNGQLPPLKRVDLLDLSSETHSTNMAVRNFFSHCDLDNLTMPWDRMAAAGYAWSSAAENIAAGYNTPTAAMTAWMNSSGHRANILSTSYRELGVGYFFEAADTGNVRVDLDTNCVPESSNNGPYRHYWTQNFGRRNNVYPVVIDREAYETASRNVQLYLYGNTWAVEMRLRNEDGAWSAWQNFATDVAWQLSSGSGVKTVHVELRNGATVRGASDTILLDDPTVQIFTDGFESGDTSAWSTP